jgi:hypothetical protein
LIQSAAEVSVDQALFGARDGFEQACVRNPLVPGKPCQPSRLEYPHRVP